MGPALTSRRAFLRAGSGLMAIVAAGGLSGCSGVFGGSDLPARSDPAVLQHAPERTIAAAHLDVKDLLADRQLEAAIDTQLGVFGGADDRIPRNTSTAIDLVADRTGLDPRDLESVLVVVVRPKAEDSEETDSRLDPLAATKQAALVRSRWSTPAVAAVLERAADSVRTDRYRGFEVRTATRGGEPVVSLGIPDEGVFAVGRRPGVEKLLDVAGGDASASETRLATALAAARPGPARVAVAPRLSAERTSGFGDPVALLAGKIDVAYGGVYQAGDRRGIELLLETGSGFDAEDVHESAESVLALARSGEIDPAVAPIFGQAEATRSGSTVTLRYEASVDGFASTLLSIAASAVVGEEP